MKPVRLGVIGCGVIGSHHLQAATQSPQLEVTAIADLIEPYRERAKERFAPKKVYEDGMDVIRDPEVEAIVLAFPTVGRIKLALEAFAHGKHVLTEKPVAMNAGEVQSMIDAKGDLVAGCCSCRYRFTTRADLITDFIANGALGDLRMVYCRALGPAGKAPDSPRPEWRLKKHLNGGGILVNWGCYDLDYLLGITGWTLKPQTVFAQTWTIPPVFESHIAPGSDAETYYTALVRCEGGTILSIERGEYMPARSDHLWQIIGDKGSLRLSMTNTGSAAVTFDATDTTSGTAAQAIWEDEEASAQVHDGPVIDFAAAIREGRPTKTPLEHALIVQQITDGIYASAASGNSVTIE